MRPLGRLRQAGPISRGRFMWVLKQPSRCTLVIWPWVNGLWYFTWLGKNSVETAWKDAVFCETPFADLFCLIFYGISLARLSSVIIVVIEQTSTYLQYMKYRIDLNRIQLSRWNLNCWALQSTSFFFQKSLTCFNIYCWSDVASLQAFYNLSIHGFCSLTSASCRGLSCNLAPVPTRLSGWT